MKTVEQLRAKAKELSKETLSYSRQGIALLQSGNMKEGSSLMRQAHETNKRFQVVLDEIIRLEKLIS
jgi:hypothetical protein